MSRAPFADVTMKAGETRTVGQRILPDPVNQDNLFNGLRAGEGLPVRDSMRFGWSVEVREKDYLFGDDYVGTVVGEIKPDNNWGLGTFTKRSGDVSVTFEVRKRPLADLQIVSTRIAKEGMQNQLDRVCFTIRNAGVLTAAPAIPIALTMQTSPDGQPFSHVAAGSLAPNEQREHCFDADLPGPGLFTITAGIDRWDDVPEIDEKNNLLTFTLDRRATGPNAPTIPTPVGPAPVPLTATPLPTPTPQPRPDLLVSAILVNGQSPMSTYSCEAGPNRVTAVVKNTGTGSAGASTVRLTMSGTEVATVALPSLAAGQERQVHFDGVMLATVFRPLSALVDPANTVVEPNEVNNSRNATVRCQAS